MAARESWTARLRGVYITICMLVHWCQAKLLSSDYCDAVHCPSPFYQPVSDRRGGRTAWSIVCQVNGRNYPARYWYDSAREDQAREDAAEVALRTLTQTLNTTAEPMPATYYART
ncbi:hypothetical protein P154DRAFT_526480 [Amniculicola lignicola CBS 123094]|uniref:DRBM domain-containing protein n=1 Tax=Amniculicola lignicola CBS 123094 TaxID=1392246 RepID=A0A6A5W0Q5_9PLEO|nr:hypothetical protein P154DRAFT_526480 [Amniculicola lignicola CBS 123094]